MTDKRKLVELLRDGLERWQFDMNFGRSDFADYLLANGVVVREKGEWRNNKDDYPECDQCGYMPQYDPMIDDIYYSDFCPNCGSDMRGAENNG